MGNVTLEHVEEIADFALQATIRSLGQDEKGLVRSAMHAIISSTDLGNTRPCAVFDIIHNKCRGFVAVCADTDFIDHTWPGPLDSLNPGKRQAWNVEIGNLVVGNVKSWLVRKGLPVEMSFPLGLNKPSETMAHSGLTHTVSRMFTTSSGRIAITISLRFGPDVTLTATSDAEAGQDQLDQMFGSKAG
jgi:hypothetical protein